MNWKKALVEGWKHPSSFYYFFQSFYRRFIRKEYKRIYNEQTVEDILEKIHKCPDCFFNGACIHCGCDFDEFILTDKQCTHVNVSEQER